MCIMFIKDFDMAFPSDETMKICWDDNRDGAGYAWYDKTIDEWHVVKGLMSWTAFLEKFNEDREKYELDKKSVVVHFRVGTSGPEIGGATHPFPAVATEGVTVNTLEYTCKGVFFHNGTVGQGTKDMSDTQVATLDYVQPMVPHIFENNTVDDDLMDILAECLRASANRYVITYGSRIKYLGSWVKDAETGMVFSNNRYKEDKTRYHAAATAAQYNPAAYLQALGKPDVHVPEKTISYELIPRLAKVTPFLDQDGMFNWTAWDNRYQLTDVDKEKDDNTTLETIKVYDEHGNVKYTVTRDQKEEEPWESIKQEDTPDAPPAGSVTCVSCNLFVMPNELVGGECPGCGTILAPEQDASQRNYNCPTCDKELSIELIGFEEVESAGKERGLDDFCQCWACGCVWGYTVRDNPWVLGYIDEKGYMVPCDTSTKAVG